MEQKNAQERLLFRNLNIGFGKVGDVYFIEDAHQRVYLSADDIDRIASEMRFAGIEELKNQEILKNQVNPKELEAI